MNKQTDDLISVIIPVYNAEPYIENLLESLFRQTYTNFEIILAYDEKSTDGTLELIQRLAETHPMIIDIANDSSVGAARNRGFALASGEFVVFVDADDEVMPEYLESLHHIFELYPELDVACCNALRVEFGDDINKVRQVSENSVEEIIIFERDDSLNRWILQNLIKGIRAAWPYLARRQYLHDKNIKFPDYSMAEDQIWVAHVIGETKAVGYTSKPLYLYIQNPSSLCNTYGNLEQRIKRIDSCFFTRDELLHYIRNISKILGDTYMASENLERYAVTVIPYREWISCLKKYKIKTIFINPNDTGLSIHKAESLLFKLNKKLYYISVRTFAGMPPETPSEKIFGAGFRTLQSLYHLIK